MDIFFLYNEKPKLCRFASTESHSILEHYPLLVLYCKIRIFYSLPNILQMSSYLRPLLGVGIPICIVQITLRTCAGVVSAPELYCQ